jgi:hypothetical protein
MSRALSVSLGVPSSPGTYSAALEGLTGVNEVLMRRDPNIPPLYSTGTRWEIREGDPTETQWRFAPDVATSGWGDCQDLSAYRAAELRVTGEDPKAHVRVYPTGTNKYHAVVARGNGLVEDPSTILGMPPFPGEPVMTNQLPAIQGPRGGSPGGGPPVFSPDAMVGIRAAICGMHPYTAIVGMGFFGEETGCAPKLARIKDAAPEFQQPTFHVTGHKKGKVCGWKGVYRMPLKDGTAIVGMTRTYAHPADCIGDGAGLISDVAHSIAKSPPLMMALSPFSAGTTLALMDPSVQHALGNVGRSVKSRGNGSDDSWPATWGRKSPGPKSISRHDAAIVGVGLSCLNHIVTNPHAVVGASMYMRGNTFGPRPTSTNSANNPAGGNITPQQLQQMLAQLQTQQATQAPAQSYSPPPSPPMASTMDPSMMNFASDPTNAAAMASFYPAGNATYAPYQG